MHRRTATRLAPLLIALALCLRAAGADAAFGVDDPIHDFILEIAVDADPTGNKAEGVAAVDSSHVVPLAANAHVDVVVDQISNINTLLEPGCDNHEESGCGLTQLQLELTYDPQIVQVIGVDPNQLLCANGCPNRISNTDTVPDGDGVFWIDEKDDVSVPETGEGVLVRVLFECLAPGQSTIGIDHPVTGIPQISDASGGVYPVSVITPATLVCPETTPIAPNEEVALDLTGDPFDADDTGLRLLNVGSLAAKVELDWIPGPPLLQGDTVQPGFALVDGTLLARSDIQPGELRARYRIEFDGRAVRRAGIRASEIRLMRRDAQSGRWVRAVRAIRARAVRARYLPRMDADFVLGHHGYSAEKSYVWGVVDVNSRYAVGGPLAGAPIPALGPLGLLAVGAALLGATGWELRRRK